MGEKKGLQKGKLEVLQGRVLIDRFEKREGRIILKSGERLVLFFLPSRLNKDRRLDVYLRGDGSRVEILGALLGRQNETSKIVVNLIHQGLRTSAYTHLRAVLFDNSQAFFSGLIKIEKAATLTTSLLEHRVLLMGDQARAESLPSLEIEANEVKASHAATIGQIDERQLFYLQSRGIERRTAVRMVIEGFFEPVLSRIGEETVVARVRGELWADVLKSEEVRK